MRASAWRPLIPPTDRPSRPSPYPARPASRGPSFCLGSRRHITAGLVTDRTADKTPPPVVTGEPAEPSTAGAFPTPLCPAVPLCTNQPFIDIYIHITL